MQLYLNDPIWTLLARGRRLTFVTTMVTMLILARGIRVAWKKGARGTEVPWIGVAFELRAASAELALTINVKLMSEIRTECEQLMQTKVVGLLRAERLAGKLSWAAGVAPRSRWAAACLYAAVAAARRDVADGTVSKRRAGRRDKRQKEHLLHTKRILLALTWSLSVWRAKGKALTRVISLRPTFFEFELQLDASPWGGAAVLRRAATPGRRCSTSTTA